MADEHTSAIIFEEDYNRKVTFFIGCGTTATEITRDECDQSLADALSTPIQSDPVPKPSHEKATIESKIAPQPGGLSGNVVDGKPTGEQLPDKRLLQTRKLAKQLAVEIEEALETRHIIGESFSESQFRRLGAPTTITTTITGSQSDSGLAELAASLEHDKQNQHEGISPTSDATNATPTTISLTSDATNTATTTTCQVQCKEDKQAGYNTVMKKFEETEKLFREEFFLPDTELMSSMEPFFSSPSSQLTSPEPEMAEVSHPPPLPPPPPPERLQSQISVKQNVGLDHLDNLARLMEQLSAIKEENTDLRKRCTYLQDTKSLLQLQNEMLLVRSDHTRGIFKGVSASKVMQYLSTPSPRKSQPRCPSDSSDAGGNETKQPMGKLHQRSQSVGSIDFADIDLPPVSQGKIRSKSAEKDAKDVPSPPPSRRRRFENKKSRKFQKVHSRVKKLFSGKPESGHKSDTGAITAEQLVRVNSKQPQQDGSAPGLMHLKSVSGTMAAADATRDKISSSSAGPPSPNSVKSEPTGAFLDQSELHELLYGDRDDSPSPQSPLHPGFPKSGNSTSSPIPSPHGCPRSMSQSALSLASEEVQSFLARKEDEHSLSDSERDKDMAKMRMVKPGLVRRQSSPTLSTHSQDDTALLAVNSTKVRSSSFRIKKSNSDKGSDSTSPWHLMDHQEPHSADSSYMHSPPFSPDDHKQSSGLSRRTRSAWGRVKDIIHTRKDSLKRKNRRSHSGGYALDLEAELASDGTAGDRWAAYEKVDTGCLSDGDRSPAPHRKSVATMDTSPALQRKANQWPVDVNALMGGVSDEFNRKMLEWEEKKKRANSFTCEEPPRTDSTNFSEEFIRKMEEWERKKGLASSPGKPKPPMEDHTRSPGSVSPTEQPMSSTHGIQKNLSSSFSKTVQEWEKIKEQRSRRSISPSNERKSLIDKKARKERSMSRGRDRSRQSRDRDRSRQSRDRSRQKFEKEIQKKEQYIEKERQKLEKMKMKLDISCESSSGGSEGMSQEFIKKLEEWEATKGMSPTDKSDKKNNQEGQHARAKSQKYMRDLSPKMPRERQMSDSCVHPSDGSALASTLSPPTSSSSPTPTTPESPMMVEAGHRPDQQPSPQPQAHSPLPPSSSSEPSPQDTTVTSTVYVANLEEKNKDLAKELELKMEDILILEDELVQLTERINMMNKELSIEKETHRRELWATSKVGQYTIESDLMKVTLQELEKRVKQVQDHSDRLASEKRQLEAKTIVETRRRNEAEQKLLKEIEDLQVALDRRTLRGGRELFQQLYHFVIKVQAQLNDLRLGVMERDSVIEQLERHLLVQEVTNRLLVAQMDRQNLELGFFHHAQKKGTIRRWKTFAARDIQQREEGHPVVKSGRHDPSRAVPQSYKAAQRLSHSLSHRDLNSLQLHMEWLEGLRKEVNTAKELSSLAVQVDPPTPPLQTTVEAQTVMTLCHCSYVPGARLLPEEGGADWVKSRQVQTSLPDLSDMGVQSSYEDVSSDIGVDTSDMYEVAYTSTQTSLESPTPDVSQEEDSNVEVTFTFDLNSEQPVTKPAEDKKVTTDSVVQTEVSSDEERSRKKKLLPHERLITRTCSKDSSDMLRVIRTRPELRSALQRQHFAGQAHRRRSTGTVLDDDDSSSCNSTSTTTKHVDHSGRPPQPPHSPVIRSKYVRKLKNSSGMPPLSPDARIFNATPPRRMIRHRKISTDRISNMSNGSSEKTESETGSADNLPAVPMRERTRSDSSMLHPRLGSHSSEGLSSDDRNLLSVSTPSSPPAVSSSEFDYSALPSDSSFRKSPSPSLRKCTVSPVRRLKTAAELLQDSERKRRSLSASCDEKQFLSSDKLESTIPFTSSGSSSSDKENDKRDCKAKKIVKHLSREGTPVGASSAESDPWTRTRANSDLVPTVVEVLDTSPSTSDKPKPPLGDLTNEGQTKQSQEIASTGLSITRQKYSSQPSDSVRTKVKDDTKVTSVKKRAETYELQAAGGRNEGEKSRSKKIIKPDSTTTLKSDCCGVVQYSSVKKGRQDENPPATPSPKESRGRGAALLCTGKESRSHKLFGRKGSGRGQVLQEQETQVAPAGKSAQAGGAVSTLCMQAMKVDVEEKEDMGTVRPAAPQEELEEREGAAGDGRGRRGKFLDANWLQKPKKFFKVSKC